MKDGLLQLLSMLIARLLGRSKYFGFSAKNINKNNNLSFEHVLGLFCTIHYEYNSTYIFMSSKTNLYSPLFVKNKNGSY